MVILFPGADSLVFPAYKYHPAVIISMARGMTKRLSWRKSGRGFISAVFALTVDPMWTTWIGAAGEEVEGERRKGWTSTGRKAKGMDITAEEGAEDYHSLCSLPMPLVYRAEVLLGTSPRDVAQECVYREGTMRRWPSWPSWLISSGFSSICLKSTLWESRRQPKPELMQERAGKEDDVEFPLVQRAIPQLPQASCGKAVEVC